MPKGIDNVSGLSNVQSSGGGSSYQAKATVHFYAGTRARTACGNQRGLHRGGDAVTED